MGNNYYHQMPPGMGLSWAANWGPVFGIGVLIVVLWSIFWKGLSLWHSAQRGQIWWFGIMLVVNTLGILEIIYLFGVAKLKFSTLFSSKHS